MLFVQLASLDMMMPNANTVAILHITNQPNSNGGSMTFNNGKSLSQ